MNGVAHGTAGQRHALAITGNHGVDANPPQPVGLWFATKFRGVTAEEAPEIRADPPAKLVAQFRFAAPSARIGHDPQRIYFAFTSKHTSFSW